MTGSAYVSDGDRRVVRRPMRLRLALVGLVAPAAVTLFAFTDLSTAIAALLYMIAIAVSSAFGGVGAGLVAAVASFVSFDYFFTTPRREFEAANAEDLAAGVLFLVVGIGVGTLIGRERRVRVTADVQGAEARRAQEVAEEARAEAVRAARTAERLQHAAEALSVAVSPAEVLDAVLTESVAAAEAQAGLIALVSDDGTQLEVMAARGYREDLMDTWHTFPIAASYPLSEAVRTGRPVFIRSESERLERFPTLGRTGEPTHALVCVPLTVENRTIGGLAFSFPEDQDFDDSRRDLKMALARQAAQALDRARLYEAVGAAEARVSYLAEVGELLSSSLSYEQTLARLVQISVPRLADWCTVDLLDEQGQIKRVAVGHVDPAKVEWAHDLHERFPPDPDAEYGLPHVLRTGEAEFVPEIPAELLDEAAARRPGMREVLDELGLRSWISVPLKARGSVVGALSLVSTGRVFGRADFDLATAVAARASVAIENALLYREAERRGDAARALTHVGDAVVLVDREGIVRYWNVAAEIMLGATASEAVGRPVVELAPWWGTVVERLATGDALGDGELPPTSTVPVSVGPKERWLSGAAVDFGEGCVYTLRDVTNERALEEARSDFVATASHELRTPLAAVYGAVRTLRRSDIDIGPENRELFLEIIESETERLNGIVAQILTAGQLGSDGLYLDEASCDLRELAGGVLAARVRSPESITLALRAPDDLPRVRCDGEKFRQVLVNLVENAIKYSPDGGEVAVEMSASEGHVRVDVRDEGLGIPSADHERVFEKFTRLDPGLTRGVGGTGLGLYIARELTERMGGRIGLDSTVGEGSTFTLTFPAEPSRP